MGLLQKLKSALGLDGATSSSTRHSGDVDVTVEREPSTEDEDAVKGTDTAESSVESDAPAAESDPVVTDDTDADAEQDEPDEPDESETEPEATDDTEADDTGSDDPEPDTDDAESAEADADASDDEPQGSTDPVTEIKGIGPAYADRLHGQDIETVGELADADPAAIAAETDLGKGRVSDWVERASEY